MSKADAYKQLVSSRQSRKELTNALSSATSPNNVSEQLPESLPLNDVVVESESNAADSFVVTTAIASTTATLPSTIAQPKKRGRPATGKRSDRAWIGRTYYVKRETDLDVEDYLLKLKRQGIDIDKSELVDFLLAIWVKWQQGENIDFLIDEFSPRQKSES
jgi:hypothetical protein